MTNNETPFGYTHDGTPVLDGVAGWEDHEGRAYRSHEVTPARVLQPGEVAVKRYLASDAAVHLASIRPFTSDLLRDALDAQPEGSRNRDTSAEPTAEDEGPLCGEVTVGGRVCTLPVAHLAAHRWADSPREAYTCLADPACDDDGHSASCQGANDGSNDRLTEPARPSLPEFDADGRRIRCAMCDASYDESRDAWGVCGKAECWPGSLDHDEPARPSLPERYPHGVLTEQEGGVPNDALNYENANHVCRKHGVRETRCPDAEENTVTEQGMHTAWGEGYEAGLDDAWRKENGEPVEPQNPYEKPAEQGDTGSDEPELTMTWLANKAEDRAVRRANDYTYGQTDKAYELAKQYTDRKVAEAVAQIVAALRERHSDTKNLAALIPGDLLWLANRLQALADGENGGAE